MKPRPLSVALAVVLALAVSVGARSEALTTQKGGGRNPLTNYPVQVTFRDATTDAITSDGRGTYVDGVSGVTAELQFVTSTGRTGLLMQFATGKRGAPTRTINFAYTNPVATSCAPASTVTGGTSIAPSGPFFSIQDLGSMASGSSIATTSNTDTGTGFNFKFADPTLASSNDLCSDLVVATRTSATSWTVTTDAPLPSYLSRNGQVATTANPEEVGSMAQVSDASGFLGNYRMPFMVTISCLLANTASQPNNCPNPGS